MKKIATSIFVLLIALPLTAQSTKQVLHTVHQESTYSKGKTEYMYNELGKEEKLEEFLWNADLLRWEPRWKIEHTYDALGNLTSYQSLTWDYVNLQWAQGYRLEYFCRFGDYIPDSKRYVWNQEEKEWEYYRHWYTIYNDGKMSESSYVYKVEGQTSWKREYTYDEHDNLIKLSYLNWNEDEQKWKLDEKYEYQYNVDHQKIEEQYFRINTSSIWDVISKITYTYTPTGDDASYTHYDMENGEWIPDARTIYEYNTSGKITLKSEQVWREDFQGWGNRRTLEYTYDAVGNEIESIDTWWNDETLIFSESRRYEREFDQNNNLIHYTLSRALIPGQFFLFIRETYTYDYNYQGEDIVPAAEGNMLLKSYKERWNADLNDWVFDSGSIYEYSPAEVRTPPDLDINYVCSNVHPNPATDYITFRVVGASTPVRIHLFDTTGKALSEEILGDGNTLSVSHLQRGVYFYQLLYNRVRQGGKFMVK